ncbi:hypothetical protein ACFCP7_17515 [Paenibacillus elgii]
MDQHAKPTNPGDNLLLPQLMKVSAFTRYCTINNEPVATLFIGNPNGLSKYWGDAVSIERKDYAVFFPEVNEEQPSLMMMRTLVEEGLISGEVKFPTQLTVTEKGSSQLSGQATPEVPAAPSPAPKAPVIEESAPFPAQPSKLEGLHPKVLAKAWKVIQRWELSIGCP